MQTNRSKVFQKLNFLRKTITVLRLNKFLKEKIKCTKTEILNKCVKNSVINK